MTEPDDVPVGTALRGASARVGLLVVGLSVSETCVRGAASAAHFADVGTAVLEGLVRTGEVVGLAPLLWLIDLSGSAIASTRRGAPVAAWLSRAVVRLSAPRRVSRLLAAYLVAWWIASERFGNQSQLPWHSGAVIAAGILSALTGVELGVARWRRERVPERCHPIGGAAWIAGLVLFATLVASFVHQPVLGAAVTALGCLVFVRALLPTLELPRGATLPAIVVACGLIALDAYRPALRRFASEYAPYSELGALVLARATDLDGDGASGMFGLDCDDLDPRRKPLAPDVPDDGVDQNCRAGDGALATALARYSPGGIHAANAVRSPSGQRLPVVLVTVDALRADVLEDGTHLPRTLAWARSCIHFTQARANANSTGASMVALHAGVFPRHVSAGEDWYIGLASPALGRMSVPPTLAAVLAIVGGYTTSVVFPPFHSGNFQFLTGYEAGGTLPDTGTAAFPSASVMLEAARGRWTDAPKDRPIHLRVHLMDLHTPYPGGSNRAAYLRGADLLDGPLASFLEALPRDALVVLAADHGEAFGEHGFTQHGHTLFDEELRVPLVLCAPPAAGLGSPRAVRAPVSLADVMPTLLDLVSLEAPYRRQGESLVPLLTGGQRRTPWVYFEAADFSARGLLLGCDKWIEDANHGWEALFDVCHDPGERIDRAPIDPAAAAKMKHLLGEVTDLDVDAFRSWRLGSELLVR